MKYATILILLLSFTVPSNAELKLNATGTCTMWLKAGKNKVFRQIEEAFVLGLIDGMSIGANINFWSTKDGQLAINQVLSWVDVYCRTNPLEPTITGVPKLFNSRAEPVKSNNL